MRLTRREFNKLLALSLGLGATGLPAVVEGAAAKPKPDKPEPDFTALDPKLPLHPLLQYGAIVEPDKKVDVIVQKVSKKARGKDIADDGEGEEVEEFGLVKAHHMRVMQRRLPRMARRKDVLYISPNSAVQRHAEIDTGKIKTTYPNSTRVDDVWKHWADYGGTGKGATVVVLDTGLAQSADFGTNVIRLNLNARSTSTVDRHGHGTHVAGIIKGRSKDDSYVGVAPDCTLISAKIADDRGVATTADLLRGLQWCYDNRAGVNGSGSIDVVNLSITTATPESYKTSAVCAAVERLWLSGIVVVCASGNRGNVRDATWYPPANDPYAITAGAIDENTDLFTPFSGRGKTQDGFAKPEIYAPGRQIYSVLASPDCEIARLFPERVRNGYIRLSGTSMATPIVAGLVALLRARYPKLTPDQIKWLLMNQVQGPDGNPIVDGQHAAQLAYENSRDPRKVIGKANQNLVPNSNVATGDNGGTMPAQGYWDQGYWDQGYWDQGYWDQAYWDEVTWDMGLAYD